MKEFELNDKTYTIREPDVNQVQTANQKANALNAKLLRDKDSISRDLGEAKQLLQARGYWTIEDEAQLTSLLTDLSNDTEKLDTLEDQEEKIELAFKMRDKRKEFIELYNKSLAIDHVTIESQVDSYRFDLLITMCAYCNDTKVFTDLSDYQKCDDTELKNKVIENLSAVLYGDSQEIFMSYPENKFLFELGMIDETGEMIPVNPDAEPDTQNEQAEPGNS